jgi:hypothetical protein
MWVGCDLRPSSAEDRLQLQLDPGQLRSQSFLRVVLT